MHKLYGDTIAHTNTEILYKLPRKWFYIQPGENTIKLQYLPISALWCCQLSGYKYITTYVPKCKTRHHSNLSVPYEVSLNTLAL